MRPGLSAGSDKSKIIFTAEIAENAEKKEEARGNEIMEQWNNGILEYWGGGMVVVVYPLFHPSSIPSFHYSYIPYSR
jgi:hypothetical protein